MTTTNETTNLGLGWTPERARRYAASYTAARTPAEIEAIAAKMIELDCTVWHASAAVSGHDCQCSPCVKARRVAGSAR